MVSGSKASRLLRLALANGGELRLSDLREAGIPVRCLWELAQGGSMVRVRRGVYALPRAEAMAEARSLLLARELNGVISHQSACERLGYRSGLTAAEFHLTVLAHRRPAVPAGFVVHRTRFLRRADVTTRNEIRVTSPGRTLVDMASMKEHVSDEDLIGLFDHFVATRLLSAPQIQRYLDQAPRLRGLPRAKHILRPLVNGSKIESAAERRLLRLVEAHELPAPRTQFSLHDGAGRFVARLDFAWPEEKLAVEVDGFRYHSSSRAFVSDRERGNRILAEGWTLYRTTPADIASGAPTLMSDLSRRLRCLESGREIVTAVQGASDSNK